MKTHPSVPAFVAVALLVVPLGTPLCAQPPLTREPPDPSPTADADEGRALSLLEELTHTSPDLSTSDEPLPAEILDAVERYRAGEKPPVIQRSTTSQHPFGETQPTLRCTPNRVCDIELQAGEVIYDVAIGDQNNWISQPLTSGASDNPIPHVAIKPLKHGIATNLILGTSKRTYHIGLISPTVSNLNAIHTAHYERHLSFYYPAEIVSNWNRAEAVRRRERERSRNRPEQKPVLKPARQPALQLAQPLAQLNFDYRLKASKKKISWKPIAVFDDSVRTYIQLPRTASATTQPAIVLEEGKESVIPNYHYDPTRRQLVIHTLFDRATLFEGVGKKRLEVSIFASAR